MNQIKKISKNISSNIIRNMHLQQVRASLTKITAVVAVTMTVLAQSLIAEAQAAEPDVTRDMRALEQKGVYLTGLTHRIKTEDSLMQKILTDAVADNVDLGQAADGISDVLRYTLVIKEADYSRRVPEAMKKLTSSGYEVLKFRNAWGGKFYQGINVQLMSPAGVKTELQFHTPQSYTIKQASHGVYEIRRNPEATPEEVADATSKSIAYNAQVKIPAGAKAICWE